MSEQAKQAAPQAASAEISEFEKLLERDFKPQGDGAREDIKNAVRTLAEQALASTTLVSDDAIKTIQAIIAAIDAKLTEQINEIIAKLDDGKKICYLDAGEKLVELHVHYEKQKAYPLVDTLID